MRINSINNNNMSQKQNFGAVKEFRRGAAKEFLGFSREKAFDALSKIKDMDVWVFDNVKSRTKDGITDGYHIIVKDDRHLIKELVGTADKKGLILEKLDELLLWFKPELNGKTASVVKKIDSLDKQRIEKINQYPSEAFKKAELEKAIKDSLDGEKFIKQFHNSLLSTAENAKTTSWQDKIKGINL